MSGPNAHHQMPNFMNVVSGKADKKNAGSKRGGLVGMISQDEAMGDHANFNHEQTVVQLQ